MTKRQRKRQNLRRWFHNLRKPTTPAVPSDVTGLVSGFQPTLVIEDEVSTYKQDCEDCWAAAKRRKQNREKTEQIYARLMAERGWKDAAVPND
jgi:hypothetical protein